MYQGQVHLQQVLQQLMAFVLCCCRDLLQEA